MPTNLTPELRGLVLSCFDPYVVPVARRVCRLWRDSQQLSRQQSEDIVREVSFLLERCVLRPFIFERAQEEATDWRCVVCGSVAQDPVDLLLTSTGRRSARSVTSSFRLCRSVSRAQRALTS